MGTQKTPARTSLHKKDGRPSTRKERERKAIEKVTDILVKMHGPALKELEKY